MERREAVPSPQRILVVDDSADVREMWRLWLVQLGFIVTEACDGAEAVGKALQRRPDLVLLDVRMPVMDGLEALQRLRAEARTADVPVIMVSAEEEEEERARQLGSNAFIAKPVPLDMLLNHIRAVLARSLS